MIKVDFFDFFIRVLPLVLNVRHRVLPLLSKFVFSKPKVVPFGVSSNPKVVPWWNLKKQVNFFFFKLSILNHFWNCWHYWCKTEAFDKCYASKSSVPVFSPLLEVYFFRSPSWFTLRDEPATTTYKNTLPKVEKKLVRNFSKQLPIQCLRFTLNFEKNSKVTTKFFSKIFIFWNFKRVPPSKKNYAKGSPLCSWIFQFQK